MLGTKPWAQSTSQATNMWKSSHVAQSVGFLMWLLGLKLQHKCRHPQGSSGPRELSHSFVGLAWRHKETQLHGTQGCSQHRHGSPPFSKAGAWLLQLKGSRTAVLPFRADPAILPRRVEKKTKELQRSVRNQAMGCLGATQVMERLFLEGFGCFSSLNSWSRAEGTESQGRSGYVCLLMFLSKHSHSPLLSHTARLLGLRCAPRAGISQTHRHGQENLMQPKGASSALLITCTFPPSQLVRPPEHAALKA